MSGDTDDLYEMLEGVCPKFKNVPTSEKAVLSRHMAGLGVDAISAQTGRSVKSVQGAVDRYAPMLSRLPEDVKLRLSTVMLINGISTLASVASDPKKINTMTPLDAMKAIQLSLKVSPEVMKLQKQLMEHNQAMKALDFEGFSKSLKEG